MGEGKRNEEWTFTCSIICAVVNVHRKKPLTVEEIHPYMQQQRQKSMAEFFAMAKGAFKHEQGKPEHFAKARP